MTLAAYSLILPSLELATPDFNSLTKLSTQDKTWHHEIATRDLNHNFPHHIMSAVVPIGTFLFRVTTSFFLLFRSLPSGRLKGESQNISYPNPHFSNIFPFSFDSVTSLPYLQPNSALATTSLEYRSTPKKKFLSLRLSSDPSDPSSYHQTNTNKPSSGSTSTHNSLTLNLNSPFLMTTILPPPSSRDPSRASTFRVVLSFLTASRAAARQKETKEKGKKKKIKPRTQFPL